jgi:hypothetical protein
MAMARKRKELTPLDMVIELIRTAQLRIKIEYPTAEEARKIAGDELKMARDMLDAIIRDG